MTKPREVQPEAVAVQAGLSGTGGAAKPRETVPAASSAEYIPENQPPFDPTRFGVKVALPRVLGDVDSVELLERLRRVDPRRTAAPLYDARLKELTTTTTE